VCLLAALPHIRHVSKHSLRAARRIRGAARVRGDDVPELTTPFDPILVALADRLAPLLAERLTQARPRYADARSNPIGSPRAFLDAARRSDFPTFLRARRITALWADVEASIERRSRAQRPKPDPAADDVALLASAGIKLNPRSDRVAK
jgi:hypothetical protein